MTSSSRTIRIPQSLMESRFREILLRNGYDGQKAEACASLFTVNSLEGVYSHGVNRFSKFIDYTRKGYIDPAAEPRLTGAFGQLEQWNGQRGPGPLNALAATERAMVLASGGGIGAVALSNSNHWMRGGAYGWQSAKKGYAFIGWTNTIANMPAWGAVDCRLGNNPLVLALPYGNEAIVLDMAMSQYSYGSMELAKMKGENLAVTGGFDRDGKMTDDPALILESQRPVPIGFWKGAGLSLLLDLLAVALGGGDSVKDITDRGDEFGLSQVFIAFKISGGGAGEGMGKHLRSMMSDYLSSVPAEPGKPVHYPGERVMRVRRENREKGIPVLESVWQQILQL